MDDKTRNMARRIIYVAAGIYLVCLAYKIFSGLPESEGFSYTLGLVAMVGFGLGGAAIAVFGIWQLIVSVKNGVHEMEKQQEEPEKEQSDSKTE